MAKQTRKTNPGDAANAFVRVILSDAGAMLGGLTEYEWRRTLEWFDRRCAYTGQTLGEGEMERDHAIPMNRAQCGLHLYGKVVPATKEANRPQSREALSGVSSKIATGSNASTDSCANRRTGSGLPTWATSRGTARPSIGRSTRYAA